MADPITSPAAPANTQPKRAPKKGDSVVIKTPLHGLLPATITNVGKESCDVSFSQKGPDGKTVDVELRGSVRDDARKAGDSWSFPDPD